jgi:hypothetical protein
MSWLLNSIRAVIRNGELVYLDWALREIDPLHPDVPHIVMTKRLLEAERAAS